MEGQVNSVAWRQLLLSRAKLKASSRTSALLAGFAMVALVELELSGPGGQQLDIGSGVIILFGVCTTLLVSVHLLALMMSTCILPHMEAVAPSATLMSAQDSPHERMRMYIELSWVFSTVLGLLLFLLEIAIVFWIKFAVIRDTVASYVTTAMLIPVFIIFIIFTYTFYRKLTLHKYEVSKGRLDDLQKYYSALDTGDRPVVLDMSPAATGTTSSGTNGNHPLLDPAQNV